MNILLPKDVLNKIDELRGDKSRTEFVADFIIQAFRAIIEHDKQ